MSDFFQGFEKQAAATGKTFRWVKKVVPVAESLDYRLINKETSKIPAWKRNLSRNPKRSISRSQPS